ncbi:di- and tricarboxylate transporter [Rubidibacter lacunae KORDI 51-2]|uniref:Di-and tricarboxylate transporter n=2 Tax=Rubidibacter TaxID=582491 RepID=U5DFI1_9CHRO|nr:di- and tricarboxylate transporter [Rubidibacter lacunae KORDI 51-2]
MSVFLTLGVIAIALIFFVGEWWPVDFTALMVAIALMVLGLVTPEEGISGFGNTATVTVMAMFVLSAGVARTGALQTARDFLIRWGGRSPRRQIAVMSLVVGPISAIINNTAVVAVFLPIVEDWCKKQGMSVSRLLMPLSFAAILGGTMTVVGTSTNVLASNLSRQLGYGEFHLLQFAGMGALTFVIGAAYLTFVVPRLLGRRPSSGVRAAAEQASISNVSENVVWGDRDYGLNDYVSELVVAQRSNLVGQTLRASELQRKFDVDVLELIRDGVHFPQPLADKVLKAGDILLVRGTSADLLQIRDERGLDILPEVKFGKEAIAAQLETGEERIAEVLILSNSRLISSTLKDLRFRQRYNVTVLAIRRGQDVLRERLGRVPLRFGDLLLVQGPRESILGLKTTRELLVIDQADRESLRTNKAAIAVAIVAGVVGLAALNWLPIVVGSLLGAVFMVLTGCLRPGEIYGAVRWDVIFLLAGLIPLGIAMEKSGTTRWLADCLLALGGNLSGYWVLFFFYVATALLTAVLSNNASVVLMLPVAVNVANSLQLNAIAFMFAVVFAASHSYMTPLGYQTNTMVYGPGGYRFTDFIRVGAPLSLLLAATTPLLTIWIYGLEMPAPLP